MIGIEYSTAAQNSLCRLNELEVRFNEDVIRIQPQQVASKKEELVRLKEEAKAHGVTIQVSFTFLSCSSFLALGFRS